MKKCLRKTAEAIWETHFLREPLLSTNPLFLSNFFITPSLSKFQKPETSGGRL